MTETEGTTPTPKSASTCAYSWCEIRENAAEEHAELHASAAVDLAWHKPATDTSREEGWSAWLARTAGPDEMTRVVFEGYDATGQHFDVELSVTQVSVVMAAINTKESRKALNELLDQVQQVTE